ncbi:MAG: hypothetical protein ACYDDW_18120 [Dermatophilaceae bacterium]
MRAKEMARGAIPAMSCSATWPRRTVRPAIECTKPDRGLVSPSDERAAIALLTLSEGVGSDIHGRYAFLAFTAAVGATTFVAVRQAAGMLTAVLLTVGGSIALVAGVMVFVAVRREEKRKEQSLVTGTLIPPGYAAIVTGEQYEPGEWVPPGSDLLE